MAVQFTIWDYWGELLLLTFGAMIVFFLTAVLLMRLLLRKTQSIGIAFLPVLLIIPLMGALFTYALPVGERTECLYPEERAYTHTTAGTITAVRDAGHIRLYRHDGEFRGGVLVTIDDTEYYSMAHPELQEGASLHFTYCPDQNLIVAFSPIDHTEVGDLQVPFTGYDPPPEEPVPQAQQTLGTVLHWFGFAGIAVVILLERRFSGRLAAILQARDRRQRYEVVPNPAALIFLAASLIPFSLLIFGDVLATGRFDGVFMLLLGASMMLAMLWLTRAHIRIEGRMIRIRQYGREHTVPLSSLRAVYWESARNPFSPRQLVLRFDDGPLRLDQESHLGLENLHRRLTVYLSTNK